MPRVRVKRELCDCLDCIDITEKPVLNGNAAAQQNPPPRCLILYGSDLVMESGHDSLGASSLGGEEQKHLNALCRDGCSGMMALQTGGGDTVESQRLDALAQLLGVAKEHRERLARDRGSPSQLPSITDRFRGMSAGLMSNCPDALALGEMTGMATTMDLRSPCLPAVGESKHGLGLPDPEKLTEVVMTQLGFVTPPAPLLGFPAIPDTNQEAPDNTLDLLLVHFSLTAALQQAAGSAGPSVQAATSLPPQASSTKPLHGIIAAEVSSAEPPHGITAAQASSAEPLDGITAAQASSAEPPHGVTAADSGLFRITGDEECVEDPFGAPRDDKNWPGTSEAECGREIEGECRDARRHVDTEEGPVQAMSGERQDDVVQSAQAALMWLDSLVMNLNRSRAVHDGLFLVLLLGPGPNTAVHLPESGGRILHPRVHSESLAPPSAKPGFDSPLQASRPEGVPLCAPESDGDDGDDDNGDGGGDADDDDDDMSFVVQRPKQSFEFAGEREVDVCEERGILRVDRLPGVVRRDRVTRLGVRECRDEGAAGCILAERLLWELAYKMGRASKYGS